MGGTIDILGNIAVFEYSVKPSRVTPKAQRWRRGWTYGIGESPYPTATRVRLSVWLSIQRGVINAELEAFHRSDGEGFRDKIELVFRSHFMEEGLQFRVRIVVNHDFVGHTVGGLIQLHADHHVTRFDQLV